MKKTSYSHLTVEARDQISVLKAEGLSLRSIASELGRHHTTISRELNRNALPVRKGRYLSHKAHERSVQRKSQAHQRDRLKNEDIRRYVEHGLLRSALSSSRNAGKQGTGKEIRWSVAQARHVWM